LACTYGTSLFSDGSCGCFLVTVLYGPYHCRDRHFVRWTARGAALVCDLLPAIEPVLQTGVDPHVLERLERMKLCTPR
jgi:hypothetical protein